MQNCSQLKTTLKGVPILGALSVKALLHLRAILASVKLRAAVTNASEIKLVVGASNHTPPGWLYSDIDILDIRNEQDWRRFFIPASVDAVLAEHVIEHLEAFEGNEALKNCSLFLKPGGYMRIAVPDGYHPDPVYLDHADPQGSDSAVHGHKVFYNVDSLSQMVRKTGLIPEPLEWFDANHHFHFRDWSPEHGMVRRSSRFDTRNENAPLSYTSLIIDARKPDQ